MTVLLEESFAGPSTDPRLRWRNPPAKWSVSTGRLIVEPAAQTDFWQQTHYGFRADNGHLLAIEITGDFAIETEVSFNPVHQYDQAGLMVRVSDNCWIKTSVEHELDGPAQLGAVVTNRGYSDWSMQPFPFPENEIRLRVTKTSDDLMVHYRSVQDSRWTLIRVAHLDVPMDSSLLAGLYACSPKGAGYCAEFRYLRLEAKS